MDGQHYITKNYYKG